MAIVIPEIIVEQCLTSLIDFVKKDYKSKKNFKQSYLYKIFGDQNVSYKFDFFKEAVNIIIGNASQKRKGLDVYIGYNLERAANPSIHITIPSDRLSQSNGIGFDEGLQDSEFEEDDKWEDKSLERDFECTYNLIITSDNMNEVILIYHLLRALIIGGYEHLEHSGLQNLKFSGQDLQFQSDLVPANIFHKNLSIEFKYDVVVFNINNELRIQKFKVTGQAIES